MKFGLTINIAPDPSDRDPYRRLFDLCVRAEALGFDFIKIPHHRFSDSYSPAPWILLGALAARTSTLRLMTGVLVLPTYHPLLVAEHFAELDVLSRGRLIAGVGLGYEPIEFETVGIPFERRAEYMEDALRILPLVWTKEKASFHGQHYSFENLTVYPRPAQRPHPPVWVGAYAKKAVERAARLADGWMMPPQPNLSAMAESVKLFRQVSRSEGRSSTLCLMRQFAVGRTRQDVEQTWLPGLVKWLEGYWHRGVPPMGDEVLYRKIQAKERITLDDISIDRACVGSPEDCIRAIKYAVNVTGCDYFQIDIRQSGIRTDPDIFSEQMEFFARDVLPSVRELSPPAIK